MFERSCVRQHRLFTFVRHCAYREVSCEMLTNVCRAWINLLKLSCVLHYPLTVWSHIFTGCSQGGKVTLGNTLCTFCGFCHEELGRDRGVCRIFHRVGVGWRCGTKTYRGLIEGYTDWEDLEAFIWSKTGGGVSMGGWTRPRHAPAW